MTWFVVGVLVGAVAMFVVMLVGGVFIAIMAATEHALNAGWDRLSRTKVDTPT